jgi:arylsulfatase A-like enzyme
MGQTASAKPNLLLPTLPERDPQVPDWSSVEDVENWDLKMAVYAAQVHSMDRGVGRILAALESSKLAENTVVMFLSDNGGCHEELDKGSPGRISNGSVSDREYWSRERAQRERPAVMPGPADSFTSYMRPWAYLSNTPFQQYKRFVHEGGISTPLIVSAPGLKQGGRLIRTPGHIIDVMPTCLELAGARYPAERNGRAVTPVAGRSLVPLLGVTSAASRSTLFWEHEGNAAVRDGDWKVVRERGRDWELYNMSADRTETSNLAGSDPARLKAMVTRYEQWAAESNVLPWEEVQKLYGSAR